MVLDMPKPLHKPYGIVAATNANNIVPKTPQPSKMTFTWSLNMKTPIVSIRPTEIMRGLTYGLSKCLLKVIPEIEMKKTSTRVK